MAYNIIIIIIGTCTATGHYANVFRGIKNQNLTT